MSLLPKFFYKKESPRKKQNLRQQVKQAKKQLAALEYKRQPSNQVEMVIRFERKRDLQEIINFKRKPSRNYYWNETHEFDWKKLTYIAVCANYEVLAELKSPNGKPLKPHVVDEFLHSVMQNQFFHHATKVSKMEKETPPNGMPSRILNRVTYSLKGSNDRTKQKRFHSRDIYYQQRGEDQLYKPQIHGVPVE